MESEKVYYDFSKDKLFSEYHHTMEGAKYLYFNDYLKLRGLSDFKSVLVNSVPLNQYTIINKKQFLFIKIKYGI